MASFDRLSALMSRFELSVVPCPAEVANFWILADGESATPGWLVLGNSKPGLSARILTSAVVNWGGLDNPLLAALPDTVEFDLSQDPDMAGLAALFVTEHDAARCGVASVLNRLGEVLIVRLMRAQIERGALFRGLLAALADPRLSRAVVAIHDRPDHPWRLEALAQEAGLSVSRFSDLFRQTVGLSPLAYLRRWRLILAKQDIERGERIQRVANRYCYGSAEALSRAMSQAYGCTPMQLRKAAMSAV